MRQVILCQHGARHRYALARILEQQHRLKALYTDSSDHSMLGRVATFLDPLLPVPPLNRLAARRITGVPKEKVFSTDTVIIHDCLSSLFRKQVSEQTRWGTWLSSKMIHWGVEPGDIIYNMYCENLTFLQYARKIPGVTIITDMYINPLLRDIVAQFHVADAPAPRGVDLFSKTLLRQICQLSDQILCPSNFVREGVLKLSPETAERIRVCPYGSSLSSQKSTETAQKGRFFWAGGTWFRKGLHLLAAVADELKKEHPDMEFRAAGISADSVPHAEKFQNITFLGRLDRRQMLREFQMADAFVFPSFCEGMAGVVLEAIRCGCPVITTHEAGIDGIIDNRNGILVPTGDVAALRAAILHIYNDREFRNSLQEDPHAILMNYSEEAWSDRLEVLLNSLDDMPPYSEKR